ncbi:MAG: CBS domain-containing protein [Desulfobacterales bacterium]
MSVITTRNVLTGIRVKEAMRHQVIRLYMDDSLDQCIRHAIKYKVNAILVTDKTDQGVGVVSKTDLMSAYYAGLPLDLSLESIMVSPPVYCHPDDPLEKSVENMRASRIHRLYVTDDDGKIIIGVLAYPDIVGLLYRLCRKCKRNLTIKQKKDPANSVEEHIRAKEVMSPSVLASSADNTLFEIMEALSEYRLGAVLIRDTQRSPVGVVSKTDLIIAYRHGVQADMPAETIMNAPVRTCRENDFLVEVIQQMIFSDVHRLFVQNEDHHDIAGVISLTDAALVRSGSCRACTASRFLAPQA